jgi:hypothetical protein
MSNQNYNQIEVDDLIREAKYETAKEIFDGVEKLLKDRCVSSEYGLAIFCPVCYQKLKARYGL